jgi:demethylmenaquinone methyltransferase/2-methoxy-6-polyprenyl-1,4-benzoquinol methylase
VLRRRLDDGREFQVYKVFHDPACLTDRSSELGWRFDIRQTDHYFIYGCGHRTNG